MQMYKQIITAAIASVCMLAPLVMPVIAEYAMINTWFEFLYDFRIGLSITILCATIYLVLPWFAKKFPNLENYVIPYESNTLFFSVLAVSAVSLICVWTIDWGYSILQTN